VGGPGAGGVGRNRHGKIDDLALEQYIPVCHVTQAFRCERAKASTSWPSLK
jgi:hypothetical protein